MQKLDRFLSCLLLIVLCWASSAHAQGDLEVLDDQAGLYPVKARLSPTPPKLGQAHLVVDVGAPVEPEKAPQAAPLNVSVVFDMPTMASMKPLKLALKRTAEKVGSGRFEGDAVLSMNGVWRLRVIVTTPNGEFHMLSRFTVGKATSLPRSQGKSGEICGPQGEVQMRATCQPDPPRVGENRLRLEFPTSPKFVMVGIEMAGMPMAIPPREAQRQTDGSFAVSVPLTMQGVWYIRADVDGQVLAPVVLTVPPPPRAALSLRLLYLSLAILLPLGVWWKGRGHRLAPHIASAALVISTLWAGSIIESYWPPDTSMGMAMDMNTPDMGMSSMTAPVPVLESRVQRAPLAVRKKYPGRVLPGAESIIVAPLAGPLLAAAEPGRVVKAGQVLGRVGGRDVLASGKGVLLRRLAEPGAVVTAGTPLFAMGDIRKLRVQARVPVLDHDALRPGLNVDVLDGENALAAQLTGVSAVSEGEVFVVEALINNERPVSPPMDPSGPAVKPGDDGGRPGIFSVGQDVVLRCVVTQLASVLSVPREAVRESSGKLSVFVIQEVAGQKVAHRRQVTLGISNETHSQVISGLQEGETVVAAADDGLQDGAVVTPATWGSGTYRDLLLPRDSSDSGHSP